MTVPEVYAVLVGQDETVATLSAASAAAAAIVRGEAGSPAAMTHAWMFTGPPGSGRSVAARAFAAALLCPQGGCGHCANCHTTLVATHADMRVVVPDGLSIKVSEIRDLVLRAGAVPTGGRWQVVVIEDADRLTEQAANALLKAIEEPAPRTVFLLCTPSTHPDDIPVTIRSRCRVVTLRTPSVDAIATVLERDGHAAGDARWAAAAAQGHIGRARRLVRDPDARARRSTVLGIPARLTSIGACFDVAKAVVDAADNEVRDEYAQIDAKERAELEVALGAGGTGKGAAAASRGMTAAIKALEDRQRVRRTRANRDALDRTLIDLAGFYRDVLVRRMAAPVTPVHGDAAHDETAAAARWTPESTLRRLEAVLACRTAIDANVKPLIAVEAMMTTLWQG